MKLLQQLGNNPFFNALRNIKLLLDADQKRRGVIMFGLLLVNAVFDVLGLAAIFPLIDAALEPELIQEKWYLKIAYDWIGVDDTIWFLFILAAIVFGVFIIKNAISLFIYYIQARFAFNISLRLSKKMFQHYYRQGFLYINDIDSGTKAYNIINVPFIFAGSYLMQSLILATELVVLFIIFISILIFKPATILVLLVVIVPVFVLVYQITKNRVKAIGDQRNELYPQTYANILDAMNAYPDVKLANKEQLFMDFYGDVQQEINQLDALQNGVYGKIHQRMNDIVLGLGLLVVFGSALIFRENSADIIAILSVFGLAAYRFLPSVNRIMQATLVIKNNSYLIDRLKPVAGKVVIPFEEVPVWNFQSAIRFDNISFSYPNSDQKVLDNLSFEVKKGETVGFIGSSGSGKTTLLNLLLRFLHETSGMVFIDNQPLTTNNEASFQRAIGYVQQSVYIKNGTIAENVAFGELEKNIDTRKLQKALQDAQLADFVANLPAGINTQLGENGTKLSGGQKQRIGIARALYKDAQILVFDEATSALDSETEKAIVETVNHLTTLDKTIFIVAHRISTLERCDRVYELEEGQIVRQMAYEELFEKNVSTQ